MAVPASGVQQRAKPKLRVLKGQSPNTPSRLVQLLPLSAAALASGVSSGQVISKSWNSALGRDEWVLGCGTDATAYFARQDSTALDVITSGVLDGYSSAGTFELQTAYFDATPSGSGTTAYAEEVFLTADNSVALVPGNVTTTTKASGKAILGRLSRTNGPIDIANFSSDVTPDGNGHVYVITLTTGFQLNG